MKRFIHFFLLAFIAINVFGQQAKYVFYFIGDGMGVNQVNGTEMYLAEREGRIGVAPLLFTQFPVATMATTFSTKNSVTDSAAAGTALATGHKTYNGALGVDDHKEAIYSVAVRAQKSGKKVGISTSVSIDHATPAAFYAHQPNRSMYYEIATDLVKTGFDFYAGSGFLKPDKEGQPSVFSLFEQAGYTVVKGLTDYQSKAGAKRMILMQAVGKSNGALPYAIDRESDDLTLAQITSSAIAELSKNAPKGFFLMVEGGKIDWACHGNDAATTFNEVIDMDNAIKVAYDFYKKHPKETLIVVTADHETGGIALGTGAYALNLKALQYQKVSVDKLSTHIKELRQSKDNKVSWENIKELLGQDLGLWKELSLTWEQEKKLRDEFESSFVKNNVKFEKSLYAENEPMAAKAKEVINEIAMVGWTSGNHSAGYVPVYAVGAGSELFIGKMDNTDIPKKIAKAAKYK